MSILALLFFIVPAAFGASALSALRLLNEKITRLLTGTILGLALFVALTHLTAPLLVPNMMTLSTTLVVFLIATTALHLKTRAWQHWKKLPLDRAALAILIALIGLFGLVAPKLLFTQTGGLHTGIINAYGDLGWHMANITSLQYNQALIPENPILAGEPLVYPFFTNLFSAMLLIGGATFSQSVVIPALVLIPLTLTLFYCLARELTKNKGAATIALLLLLFGGSTIGWLYLPGDWTTANQPLADFIHNLPRNYTGHHTEPNRLHLINPITSLLLPQRSFLFGMPLAITILLLLQKRQPSRRSLVTAGLVAGMLPLFHVHSALALVPVIIAFVLANPGKRWLYFFAAAAVAGAPNLLYYYQASENEAGSFFNLQVGWMAAPNNWFVYWFKNTGLLLPTALLGLVWPAPRTSKVLALAGLSLFAAANIWLFAVWEWDNTKLFMYWLLFTLPLIGWVVVRVLASSSLAVRSITIALLLFHLMSGLIDIAQITLPKSSSWQEWDQGAIAIAQDIAQLTEPGDTILAAPIHNSPVGLAGRPIYLGYPGHLWTHGKSYQKREQAIVDLLAGTSKTLPDLTPRYLLIGPIEQDRYPTINIQPSWMIVAERGNYTLYQILDDA